MKILIAFLIAAMLSTAAYSATAVLIGQYIKDSSRVCYYDHDGDRYTVLVRISDTCEAFLSH